MAKKVKAKKNTAKKVEVAPLIQSIKADIADGFMELERLNVCAKQIADKVNQLKQKLWSLENKKK